MWDDEDDDDAGGVALGPDDDPCSDLEAGAATAGGTLDGEQLPPSSAAAAEQAQQQGARTDGGRPTAAWYRDRADEELYPGAQQTVMQSVFFFLSWKQRHGVKCNAVDELLRGLSAKFLPAGNLLVPSLHLLKAVSECVLLTTHALPRLDVGPNACWLVRTTCSYALTEPIREDCLRCILCCVQHLFRVQHAYIRACCCCC